MMDRDKIKNALDLVTNDGEWPSPACEEGPQATRAAAMQRAIKLIAEALLAPAPTASAGNRCHRCGKRAQINDGPEHMGPPVCTDCYSDEAAPPEPRAGLVAYLRHCVGCLARKETGCTEYGGCAWGANGKPEPDDDCPEGVRLAATVPPLDDGTPPGAGDEVARTDADPADRQRAIRFVRGEAERAMREGDPTSAGAFDLVAALLDESAADEIRRMRDERDKANAEVARLKVAHSDSIAAMQAERDRDVDALRDQLVEIGDLVGGDRAATFLDRVRARLAAAEGEREEARAALTEQSRETAMWKKRAEEAREGYYEARAAVERARAEATATERKRCAALACRRCEAGEPVAYFTGWGWAHGIDVIDGVHGFRACDFTGWAPKDHAPGAPPPDPLRVPPPTGTGRFTDAEIEECYQAARGVMELPEPHTHQQAEQLRVVVLCWICGSEMLDGWDECRRAAALAKASEIHARKGAGGERQS